MFCTELSFIVFAAVLLVLSPGLSYVYQEERKLHCVISLKLLSFSQFYLCTYVFLIVTFEPSAFLARRMESISENVKMDFATPSDSILIRIVGGKGATHQISQLS